MSISDNELKELLEEAKLIFNLLQDMTPLKWEGEKEKVVLSAGFADPKMLSKYLEMVYAYVESHMDNKDAIKNDIKRLRGILLWARFLFNLDKLTLQEVKYIRDRLSHGFISLSGNKRLKELPIPIRS